MRILEDAKFMQTAVYLNLFIFFQVVYVKGEQATPIPGPQGPPGAPVSNIYHGWLYSSKSQLSKTMYFCFLEKINTYIFFRNCENLV